MHHIFLCARCPKPCELPNDMAACGELLQSGAEGPSIWNSIAGSVPNIAPKGQLNGRTINETHDAVNDPDCCE